MKLKDDDVFIAIPCYNCERYVSYAILSVLNQSLQNWKLVLIDDGSTDGTLDLLKLWSERDNRISYVSDGKNKGLAFRLNQSIDMAVGKYYVRMDADDIMVSDRLERQITFLEQNVSVDIVGSAVYTIDAENNIIGCRGSIGASRVKNFCHPTVVGRREWFVCNKYDPTCIRMEDYELWRRAENSSVFANMSEKLLFYREFGIPTVRKYILTQWNIIRKICFHPFKYRLSFIEIILLPMSLFIKIIVALFLGLIKRVDLLIGLRSQNSLSKLELIKAFQELKKSICQI